MDPTLSTAAAALAAGAPLRALNFVALRGDADALALRGIALAQLGDLARARLLMKRAARAFGTRRALAHARCILAEAELAFVSRDLGWPVKELASALRVLEQHGDMINAVHARHLQARLSLLMGRINEAERELATVDPSRLPPARRAAHEMIMAGVFMQRLRAAPARAAIARARDAAGQAGIAALAAEVEAAARHLDAPAARLVTSTGDRLILLDEVEALLGSGEWIVDACRRVLCCGDPIVRLAGRPVLFAILRTLAEAWPADVPRATLLETAFQARKADESHRARLRVEIGRLRRLLQPMADVQATPRGYALRTRDEAQVKVLAWPVEEEHGAVLAFLADGEAWTSSALALALGVSQRTVQRSLEALAARGKIQWFGRGRARRWTISSIPGFTTIMLLPTVLEDG